MGKLLGIFPGEGIGPELHALTLQVLTLLAPAVEVRQGPAIGMEADCGDGLTLTEEAEQFCRSVFSSGGAVLAGPGGGRFVYDCRRCFELSYKLNPIKTLDALQPVRKVDLLVVRDNLSGLYQCRETVDPVVVKCCFESHRRHLSETAAAAAREAAQRDGRVTLVRKEHGTPETARLWEECAKEACALRGVELSALDIDFACYQLLRVPDEFDVILTSNCFGDILADLGGHLMGSRGLTYGASYGVGGTAIFQTNHGAAWSLAGKDKANPCGHLKSLAWMLDRFYGLGELSNRLLSGIESVLRAGYRTADLVEPGIWNLSLRTDAKVVGTRQFGDLLLSQLGSAIKV